MAEELIKITESNGKQAVSARELYNFLEVQTPFTMWAERMFEYGFTESIDYVSLSQKSDKPKGGRPQMDYALTLDCAKEISMLQRSDKGKQVFDANYGEVNLYHVSVFEAYEHSAKIN